MSSQLALFLTEKSGSFSLGDAEVPNPGLGELLVRVQSIGLNPVDWKIQAEGLWVKDYPAILGHEVAGTVETIGEGVTQFVKGDRVFHQCTTGIEGGRKAAYQQFVIVPASIACKANSLTFDQGASLSVGIATASIPLYSQPQIGIGYEAPWNNGRGKYQGQPALILGGSSCVGQYAIQFAKLSGFSPIFTTANASLHKTRLLRLGATHVIDRGLSFSDVSQEISTITKAPISLVYDAISHDDTQNGGYEILAPGGHIVITLPPAIKRKEGDQKHIVPVTGNFHEPENMEFGAVICQHLTKLLSDEDIQANTVEIVPGGLNGIVDGLEKLKTNNRVSGKKLVVRPWDTTVL
ncbi:chaperonin 10-like protein [Hygrophoropsis aurantiaca]|uniref:Chaperonin 10-like protein n=1 Tax=Hygrophoropsis aurantiaca TaxID=72124 RepID=A0ACB8A7S5_9AGAM|nr:chaperonin 10-like protein [Hygrophoropsis aurantiaca]